jgi:hypothetical protein
LGRQDPNGGEEMMKFSVLTFNTQTLNGAENRTNIEQQLIDNKILIAGFQESRSKKSGIKLSDSGKFVNVTSAKDGQGLGIEIWIATGIPIARKEKKREEATSTLFIEIPEKYSYISRRVWPNFMCR